MGFFVLLIVLSAFGAIWTYPGVSISLKFCNTGIAAFMFMLFAIMFD